MDLVTLLTLLILFIGALGIAVFFGRCIDPVFRCRVRRIAQKKDLYLISIVSRDKKTIRNVIIEINDSLFWHGGNIYVSNKNRIFRMNKPEVGFALDATNTTEPIVKHEEGVPRIFIDEDNWQPLSFWSEPSASSGNSGLSVVGFIRNQLEKRALTQNKFALKDIAMFVLFIIIIAMLWQQGDAISSLKSTIPQTVEVVTQNTTQVITQ